MKGKQFILNIAKSPITQGCAFAALVLSVFLVCAGQREGWGFGLQLPGIAFESGAARGAVGFGAAAARASWKNGFYCERRSSLPTYHTGLHFNGLGFGFGFLPFTLRSSGLISPPHFGVNIPLWFVSVGAVGLLWLARYLRGRSQAGYLTAPHRGINSSAKGSALETA